MVEAMAFLKRRPAAMPWGGGTLLMGWADEAGNDRPLSVLELRRIPELSVIHRAERFIEFGAAVTLSAISGLPPVLELEPLRSAIRLVGTASVRNLATIGGNVAAKNSFMTLYPALACMDAALEVRDPGGARWMSVHGLVGDDGRPAFPASSIATRVRVPTEPWDATVVRRLGQPGPGESFAPTFAAAVRFEKGTVAELRLVASGRTLARDRTIELGLIGKRLPLGQRVVEEAIEAAAACAAGAGFTGEQARRFGEHAGAFLETAAEEPS